MRVTFIVAAIGLSVASCRFGDCYEIEPPPRGRRRARSASNRPRGHWLVLRLAPPQGRGFVRRHPGHPYRWAPLRRDRATGRRRGGGGAATGGHSLATGRRPGYAPRARPDVEHFLPPSEPGHGSDRRDRDRWQDDDHDHDPPDAAERRPAYRLDEHCGNPPPR